VRDAYWPPPVPGPEGELGPVGEVGLLGEVGLVGEPGVVDVPLGLLGSVGVGCGLSGEPGTGSVGVVGWFGSAGAGSVGVAGSSAGAAAGISVLAGVVVSPSSEPPQANIIIDAARSANVSTSAFFMKGPLTRSTTSSNSKHASTVAEEHFIGSAAASRRH
jgi:hypothetical protein